MHVYQRPSGSWCVVVQINGRRTTGTAPTRADALIVGARLMIELGERRRRSTVTVADLAAHHVADTLTTLSPSTLAEYHRVLANLPAELGERPITEVTAPELTGWYRRLVVDGWSIGAVRRLHELLHVAWKRTAIHNGWTVTNPVNSARPPARSPHRIEPPDPDTVRRLLAAADDTFRLYLRLAATTGARRGELVALQWADLDLARGELSITRSHVYTPASGVVTRATKTGRSGHRRIALDPNVIPQLGQHHARLVELAAAAGLPDPVWVFTHDAGVTAWHPDYPTTAFNRLRARCQVTGVRLHDLRHFVATQMLADGESLPQVGARLGHADPRTTLSFYSHWVPARDREAAARLGAKLD